MPGVQIKPDHKAIDSYYKTLDELREGQDVHGEGNVRRAFASLLVDTARERKWTLVEELTQKAGTSRAIRLDGGLRDEWQLPHGYWEAKDSKDDLDSEIRRKRDRGYPFDNIIFEDTREAVLFQDGFEVTRAEIRDRGKLADLLTRFYNHEIAPFEEFNAAIDYFKGEIPNIANGLKQRIEAAHRDNKQFQAAFTAFMELCKTALNPNISQAAVDEMLIQHMLTERIIRKVFDVETFTRRNVIAGEVEKVIDALTSQHFNYREFLGALDRFYTAIEDAADKLADFTDKQRFINTVYERFFQGYSVKIADTHGIVYTPQEIVDFMCAAVEEVLADEFGKKLGDEDVYIIDPCTGTGSFMVNLLRRAFVANPRDFDRFYREQLFANEVMLMPYYIASLNIEHTYHQLAGHYEPFEGVCFVDTLDLAEGAQMKLAFMNEANSARVERQKQAPITVIIGNPPYNVGQLNENDNNKNRKYDVIDLRVSETYARDSKATNKNALSDPYVKFFRWAANRLQGRDGVVCYVSNNSFVDQIAFDGMRKHLLEDFTRVYHLDLHGNVRQNPKLSGTTHNVFGIQVGVGVTVAIRSSRHSPHPPTPSPLHREGEVIPYAAVYGDANLWEKIKPLARQMRHEPTPAEERLWETLRNRNIQGHKFRRQHPVQQFIVDFYCAEAHLVIEVDGAIHDYTPDEDTLRQAYLESLGLRVLRFRNDDVLNNLDSVLHEIQAALVKTHPHPPAPSPILGEGEQDSDSKSPLYAMERGFRGEDKPPARLFYHRLPEFWTRKEKLDWLAENVVLQGKQNSLNTVPWEILTPDSRHTWRVPENADEFATFVPMGSKETKSSTGLDVEAIFKTYGRGVATTRDDTVYDFNRPVLIERVKQFIDNYNAEIDRYKRLNRPKDVDQFVRYDKIKWSRDLKLDLQRGNYADYDEAKIRQSLYRPFSKRYLFFDRILNEEVYVFPRIYPTSDTEQENIIIGVTDLGSEKPFMTLVTKGMADLHLVGAGSSTQCFPFYVYNEDGSNRRENITDWALERFRRYYAFFGVHGPGRTPYERPEIRKWDIFYYVYALLHHPQYRARYADNLKRELPRIPYAPDFWAFAEAGRKLAELHLNYETVDPYELDWQVKGERVSYHVEKMRPVSPRKGEAPLRPYTTFDALKVNDTLTLAGIPAEAFAYRLGNRSALEWVIDQYQVKEDKRSGISSDPNGYSDNVRYIVDLVERVVQVSVETVAIVESLPPLGLGEE